MFRYYFRRFGRPDLRYFNLSDPPAKKKGITATYVVVQDGRKYFENIEMIEALKSRAPPILKVTVGSAAAALMYKVERLDEFRKPR